MIHTKSDITSVLQELTDVSIDLPYGKLTISITANFWSMYLPFKCMHYVYADQNGEIDWNTLGNILIARLLGEVRIIV